MTSCAIVYINIDISQELMAATSFDPMDIVRVHAEKAIAGIPQRVYAIDQRVVRAAVEPPWEVFDVVVGGSTHMDPLAQRETVQIRLISRNLLAMTTQESRFAQQQVTNIPEGSLMPPDFAAYMRDTPTRKGDTARRMLGVPQTTFQGTLKALDAGMTSRESMRKKLGLDT